MRVSPQWLRANYWGADQVLAEPGLPAPGPDPLARYSTVLQEGPPRWAVEINAWRPASDNLRADGHWKWYRAKQADKQVIADLLAPLVPPATGPRRVHLTVMKKTARRLDPANLLKSFHDALVQAGLLVDDDQHYCRAEIPTIVVQKDLHAPVKSIIVLEDL